MRVLPSLRSITCAASGPDQTDCAAACDDSGRAQGDPHIQTLRGAHYTILKEGNFLAWSYSKTTSFKSKMGLEKEIPLQWKLYARYGGSFFSTKGLLLVDVNRSLALELTSEDCAWRQRIGQDGEWHKVKPVLLTSEDNATSFNVSDVRKLSGDDLLGATIILNMNSKHGLQPVARLVSHCKPGDHMDFKLNMFQKSDISFVGGELGVGHEAMSTGGTGEVHFLSSKLKTMQLRTDTEFEARSGGIQGQGGLKGKWNADEERDPVALTVLKMFHGKACSWQRVFHKSSQVFLETTDGSSKSSPCDRRGSWTHGL